MKTIRPITPLRIIRPITNLMTIGILIFLTFFSWSCNRAPDRTSGWTTESLQMPDEFTSGQLPDAASKGGRLITEYCSQCHKVPSPKAHSASDWVPVFRRMILLMEKSGQRGQMGGMGGMMGKNMPMGMTGARVPTEREQNEMLSYLQAHALEALAPGSLPDSSSIEAAAFKRQCSKCHALPNPAQHTPTQWPAVVSRMQKHAEESQLPPIPDGDAKLIIKYLQQNSGPGSD